jgi:magnesium transporter
MHELIVATRNGECRLREDVSEISDLRKVADNVIWLDLCEPTRADFDLLRDEFDFHPLALEDAATRHQRPKVDSYDDYYFIVFYAIGYTNGAAEGKLMMNQVGLFIGTNYLVTVHAGAILEIDETINRWRKNREAIGDTVGAVVYALLDAIVDHYFPVIDEIADHVEALEEQIFENFRDSVLEQVFTLKKDLLALRRTVSPSRDVLNIIIRRDMPIFTRETIVYMQDIYDHIVRVTDSIDTYRDLLSSALDGYLSMASNRMNQTMRVLTSSSIILMSMALVAGIYGMNFKVMPELEWVHGYPFAIGLMLVIGVVLAVFLRRLKWL